MDQDLRIAVILGTARIGRQSDKIFRTVVKRLEARGFTPIELDLQELQLPLFDGTGFEHPGVKKFLTSLQEANGVIVVTPEYKHSIPAALKSAFEYTSREQAGGKPLAAIGVSSGDWGGVRALKNLESIWLGMEGLCANVFLPTPRVEAFDETRPPEAWSDSLEKFLDRAVNLFTMVTRGKV